MENEIKPKVSVCVVCYNQEKYIAQCLQSLVDQVTDFPFEIIVSDDASTDTTPQIVQEFANEYPVTIKAFLQPKNLGPAGNYKFAHMQASGDYIAHLDGDDLARPGKLQAQANALDKNPHCVMSTHNSYIIDSEGKPSTKLHGNYQDGIYDLNDLLARLPFFAHSSKMVRSSINKESLSIIQPETIDIELHVFMAKIGDIIHLALPLGEYRSGVGMSTAIKNSVHPALPRATARIFDNILITARKNERRTIEKKYANAFLQFAYQAAMAGNQQQIKEFSKESIVIRFYSLTQLIFLLTPVQILIFLAKKRRLARYKTE